MAAGSLSGDVDRDDVVDLGAAAGLRGPGGLQVVPEPRVAGQELVELEKDTDVEGMELDDVAAQGLGLYRDPDAVLGGAFGHAVQGRHLSGQHPSGCAADPAQPASDRVLGDRRGQHLDVGVRADRGGEVGQVQLGQQRIAETGAEFQQIGGGPHGRGVVEGGESHLAQFGPPVLGHRATGRCPGRWP
jgi:hypothetical protein